VLYKEKNVHVSLNLSKSCQDPSSNFLLPQKMKELKKKYPLPPKKKKS
jgi:hypothetical protein